MQPKNEYLRRPKESFIFLARVKDQKSKQNLNIHFPKGVRVLRHYT